MAVQQAGLDEGVGRQLAVGRILEELAGGDEVGGEPVLEPGGVAGPLWKPPHKRSCHIHDRSTRQVLRACIHDLTNLPLITIFK